MKLKKAAKLTGVITVPGDKSISQRALLFAALAQGVSRISGLSAAGDVCSMFSCLEQLGIKIENAGEINIVHGAGLYGLQKSQDALDCGNSGTTMRLLAGVLAGQPFDSILTGDGSLCKRPMGRIVAPLTVMGATIELSDAGTAPIKIFGKKLTGRRYVLPVASAQVKSAVLLAGLFAKGQTSVVEPAVTRDHTEIMLRAMGVDVQQMKTEISLKSQRLQAIDLTVPGDISAAAFFIIAGLIVPGSELLIKNVGMNPTRCYLVRLLQRQGAKIDCQNMRNVNGEPVADLQIQHSKIKGFTVKGDEIPLLIDEIPVLAVLATQAVGESRFEDAAELRVKESDRIDAVTQNLRRLGATIEVWQDGFAVAGQQYLTAAPIETFGDHRIAMAFSIAALIASGTTEIMNSGIADVSFPDFYSTLSALNAGSRHA